MNLTYYTDHPNFGDALNPLLARQVFGNIFDHDDSDRLLFIGTIIERNAVKGCRETILGAGAGYHTGTYTLERRKVLCVRGPLTCDILGIDRSYAAIDPAILTSRFYSESSPSSGCLFMPHLSTHTSAETELRAICATVGIEYVSPLDEAQGIIGKIASARRVITEALHGAVVAESFEVPWVPVVFGSKVLAKKWRDFTASIGVEYAPVEIHTNIAFDGKVRPLDRVKYAVAKTGLGKKKHEYLPIKKATASALSLLERKLRDLVATDSGLVYGTTVKASSIARLDAAIGTFLQGFHAASARRSGS